MDGRDFSQLTKKKQRKKDEGNSWSSVIIGSDCSKEHPVSSNAMSAI
jgi:hypothetical protein